jgi:uncharacterized protein (DUF1501 family)
VEIIERENGAVRFTKYGEWKDIVNNITSQRHGNYYCDEYAKDFGEAIESSEILGGLLDKVQLKTDFKTNTQLQQQFHQVARLIATKDDRGAERDFFFVQLGGFDTHTNQVDALNNNFEQIDSALEGFVAEMEAQQVFDSVTVMTQSDFGRTLTFNGQGTDHGWAGNHFILGGSVQGGDVFNDFLTTFKEGNDYDAGRGRAIPKYPWESMLVPVAEWMGIDRLEDAFPNLDNFNRSSHIISHTKLFKP